jgi:branched-chain amino acid transport system permease protein
MTALDNVAVARARIMQANLIRAVATISRDDDLERAREHAMFLLESIGAADAAGQRCDSLPYGVKRRVEIARALAIEPHLVLLDEPAAGLNEAEQVELASRLEKLAGSGIALLIIEHNMRFLLPLAHRMMCLDHGEVIASGSPQDTTSHPKVIEAYLGKEEELD